MKKLISLIITLAMVGTFAVCIGAYQGENYVAFSSSNAQFPKGEHIAGDSNGDGAVNMLDVMSTLKYISGNKTSSLREAIDTNEDGRVNVADALLIIRHVLGEDVGLGVLVK